MQNLEGGKIKNFKELATTDARKVALQIAEAGLYAIDTVTALKKFIHADEKRIVFGSGLLTEPLAHGKRIFFVGIGKCAYDAAIVVEGILGNKLTGGIVFDVNIPETNVLRRVRAFAGTHPFPSDGNVAVSKEIVSLLTDLSEDDFVIMAVSGGGSTLLCLPNEARTCIDEKYIVEGLFEFGATIQEINTVRKHLSTARGGFLAKHAYPARVISIIFSDVPGNELGFIASGPTVKDETTVSDAEEILKKYRIVDALNLEGILIETPKEDKYFKNVYNTIVVSNTIALKAMEKRATELLFEASVVTDSLTGEAKDAGAQIVDTLHRAHKRSVFLYGGETTVKVAGPGCGGRNQELVLSALLDLEFGELVLSFASDGRDNGEYMGAIVDNALKKEAEKLSLLSGEFLGRNDSSGFFEKTGGLLKSGYTGSNVSDLIIGIKF
jgi:glycerate-2-kinase